MGAQRLNLPHYTYEDYCQWEGRWELIYGIPFAMSPLPIPAHQRIAGRLFSIFDKTLSANCESCIAYPPLDWKADEDTVLQPDFLVACGQITEKYLNFPPSLVAEILSPSTALKDRNDKFKVYESQQVTYYLILDGGLKKIEVYQLMKGKYELVVINPPSFEFVFHDNCKVPIAFDELWD